MELHEYQKRAANFMAMHKNCILSVDMGLGKTAAVLAFLNWLKPKSVLIVAPKRVAENNWHTEAEKWGYTDVFNKMVVVRGTPKKRAEALDAPKPYKIISRDNIKEVGGKYFEVLVIDELTSFKNIQSGRTKTILSIEADRKIGLTGTFLANGAIDIYAQAAAVGINYIGLNFYAWRATYFKDALQGSGLQFSKWKAVKPIEDIIKPIERDIFTLTAADYLHIPPVSHNQHFVELSKETREAYDNLEAFLGFTLNNEVLTIDEGAKFAKLQTLCNGFVYDDEGAAIRGVNSAKLEAVADFVADCKEAGEPVLLFYAYREEAIWLNELLKARGVKAESVKSKDFVKRWNDGEIEVLFAHPASAGHGLNLQHGGRVIVWSSLTYSYELFAQANARLARQGQRQNVQIHYFFAEKTCEERIYKALVAKQAEQNAFLTFTKQ